MFIATKPGEESTFFSFSTAIRKFYSSVDGEVSEALTEVANRLEGVEIKLRCLSRREVLRLLDLREKAGEDQIAQLDADEVCLRSALVAIKGTDVDTLPQDALIDALSSSGVTTMLAGVIRSYQLLDAQDRRGFFI
jgi:hypothetical protein